MFVYIYIYMYYCSFLFIYELFLKYFIIFDEQYFDDKLKKIYFIIIKYLKDILAN